MKGSAVRVLEAVRVEDETMGTSTQPQEAELHTFPQKRERLRRGGTSRASEREIRIESELHELECGSVREDTNQGERTLEEEGNEAWRQQGHEETKQEIQYEDGLRGRHIEEELQELGVRVEKAEVVLLE